MATGNTLDDLGIRPLTARSVLLSTLLGVEPPELPAAVLVATARLFGIEEGTARVALSRMAAAGEVVADDGRYALAGRLLERQHRQAAGRHPPDAPWDGRWRVAVVTAGRRPAAERADLRAALAGGRLAEWREGVWTRPANLPPPALAGALAEHVTWLDARPEAEPAALAARLWDLDGWVATAEALLDRLERTPPSLETLAPGFVLSAAVLRHLAADPQLPHGLLPAGWPGERLRAVYDRWDDSYQQVLAGYHRSIRGDRNVSAS